MRATDKISVRAMCLKAMDNGFAAGSFSPRYLTNIGPVLRAAQNQESPVIVQISQNELNRFGCSCDAFAKEYRRCKQELGIRVPAALHLDHTKDLGVIREAVAAGFDSVMIDASEYELEKNISIVREAVDYAHRYGVEVEAEIGKISSNDRIETDSTSELYTDPDEAARFVDETDVDLLAVSVGTVHGAYLARKPHIELKRIAEIRERVQLPLVLHGASGVPADLVNAAITLPGGGVSKINIATDLEQAFLKALGRGESTTNQGVEDIGQEELKQAHQAVMLVAEDKMEHYLLSSGRALIFGKGADENCGNH